MLFEKYVIVDGSLENIYDENGEATAFRFKLRLPYYRAVRLSMVDDIRVTVDGRHYGKDKLLVTTEEGTFTLDEMATMTDFYWGFGEIGTITVLDPRDFERYFNGGVHVVEVGIDLRISYANFSVKKTKVLRKV